MKNNTKLLLFLIGVSFFSCNGAGSPSNFISNFDKDFPVSEKLDFKPFNKYDILKSGYYMIDDSILWYFPHYDENIIGCCYDLNSGEELSTIAMRGNAAHELVDLNFYASKMIGDSIQLYSRSDIIKTFAKKDIIDGKPMNERAFSVITPPDSINIGRMVKLPNGSVIGTIRGTQGQNPPPEIFNINNKSIFIFNNNEVTGYETINHDSFDLKMSSKELEDNTSNYMIKQTYAESVIELKGNDMAVFSPVYQFILYTFDINSGTVVKEKRYTDMKSSGVSHMTANEMEMRMGYMKSNDKYIFCPAYGYFSKEDKELKLKKRALFVFDWDLNPIKRFELPNADGIFFIISNDCSSIYTGMLSDEEGLILTKADIEI